MKNSYIKPFSKFNESASEPISNTKWYYGIADCHGLESFMEEPEIDDASTLDNMFSYGLSPYDANDDPAKKEINHNLNMMQMRCNFNSQRHPVVYRASLAEDDAEMVQDLLDSGDYINALKVVKGNSKEVQLTRGRGGSSEKAWRMIPNPDLDPMHNDSSLGSH
jgi:hypothetical protein